MSREKKTVNRQHCGREFTQARDDQKYCKAQCRYEHFFEKRDNEKERLEALRKEQIEALKKEVNELKAQVRELEQNERIF
jgi:hypothetical protein